MRNISKGLIVTLLHVLIICSLAGKLLYDRATRPRVWVKTGAVDPDLPIRGRYLTLSLEVQVPTEELYKGNDRGTYPQGVDLAVEHGQLVAHSSADSSRLYVFMANRPRSRPESQTIPLMLTPPVDFFLPEHGVVPRLEAGDELWAEVTVPKKGPPRPIALALKRGSEWQPLTYR